MANEMRSSWDFFAAEAGRRQRPFTLKTLRIEQIDMYDCTSTVYLRTRRGSGSDGDEIGRRVAAGIAQAPPLAASSSASPVMSAPVVISIGALTPVPEISKKQWKI